MFDHKVVVRFKDGTTLHAHGENFLPGEEEILVRDLDGCFQTVALKDVKLVCFVREFVTIDKESHSEGGRLIFQPIPGRTAEITFRDGEKIQGVTTLSSSPRSGFFLSPLNPSANNIHMYVNPAEVLSFRFLN